MGEKLSSRVWNLGRRFHTWVVESCAEDRMDTLPIERRSTECGLIGGAKEASWGWSILMA